MLRKELMSALLMTGIIILFTIPTLELSGDAYIFPAVLLACMLIFNIAQYLLAVLHTKVGTDKVLTLAGYPLLRVGILFILTVVYLGVLQILGFYFASLVFFVSASLIAQPTAITGQIVVRRVVVCSIFVGALYLLFTVLLAVQIPKGFLGF